MRIEAGEEGKEGERGREGGDNGGGRKRACVCFKGNVPAKKY